MDQKRLAFYRRHVAKARSASLETTVILTWKQGKGFPRSHPFLPASSPQYDFQLERALSGTSKTVTSIDQRRNTANYKSEANARLCTGRADLMVKLCLDTSPTSCTADVCELGSHITSRC
jgi:hypothetical protein